MSMPCTRYLIICEGESERAYLQRLQAFFDQQPLPSGSFEPLLRIFAPQNAVAQSGKFSVLKKRYSAVRKENKKVTIRIWADFDLYLRNDHHCATHYRSKPATLPDFLFSFHNFEDFLALHLADEPFARWLEFGRMGHFETPLHSPDYMREFETILPGYRKAGLPPDFITWQSLANLKRRLTHQPIPRLHDLGSIDKFADFLIAEIERAYPDRTDFHPSSL